MQYDSQFFASKEREREAKVRCQHSSKLVCTNVIKNVRLRHKRPSSTFRVQPRRHLRPTILKSASLLRVGALPERALVLGLIREQKD